MSADFIYILKILQEEADDSIYKMELFIKAGIVEQKRQSSLMKEGYEILSIVVSSINTARIKSR